MPYNRQIPDAPIAGSMLPRATSVDASDLLVLIKPNNPLGQRNKSVEAGTLLGSTAQISGLLSLGASKVSNILTFSGRLASTRSSTDYTEVAHVDIDPRWDVQFHVWGTSLRATDYEGPQDTTYTVYDYGFRARVRQYWEPDDVDRDLEAFYMAGHRTGLGNDDVLTPTYNAFFGATPHNYNPDEERLSLHPTKRVTLYLSSGSSYIPYQALDPASFSLNIQAIATLSAVDDALLQKTGNT